MPLFRTMRAFCLLVLAASFSHAQNFGTFTELPSSGIPGDHYITAAFGDYNNDGFVDLAVTRATHLLVFRNTPSNPGTFVEVLGYTSLACNGRDDGPERQVAWADFDNDGDLDLYANSGGGGYSNWLYVNSGAPNYELVLETAGGCHSDLIIPAPNNAQGAGWLDVNHDGFLDLFESAGSDQSSIYRNQFDIAQPSTNWFVEIGDNTWCTRIYRDGGSYINGSTPNMNGSYSTQADLNNDGYQDILYAVDNWSSTVDRNARLVVWLNLTDSGSTTFEFYDIGQYVLSTPTARNVGCFQWSGVVAWDADNDGDLDVLYANSNGQCTGIQEDYFFENTFGYYPVPFSGAFDDALQHNTSVPFGTTNNVRSGGVAFGDLNNDGWQDLYIVHEDSVDNLYIHSKGSGLTGTTYQTVSAANDPYGTGLNANGATFGDIDNDGDLDLFLCNGGRIYYNTTNSNYAGGQLHPSHPNQDGYRAPQGASAEHYLDVMVSGASAEALISTKDGIGSRVYLFHMTDPDDESPASYGPANLVGMREIDGGSGYGSQATQVQHFGLDPDLYGLTPHLEHYAIKAVFMTGDTLWKWDVVPDSVQVRIPYNDNADTTYLAQTIEVSLLEVYNPPVSRIDLDAEPPDATIPAGGTVTYTGTVYTIDEYGNEYAHPTYGNLIEWSLDGPAANPALSTGMGSSTVFTGTEAYAEFTITARIVNPEDTTNVVTQSMTVTVVPGTADHISIEAAAGQPADTTHLRDDNPVGLVSFLQTETDRDVYAIARDQYGNWVGPVDTPSWMSLNSSVVTVTSPTPAQGQGRIHRETIQNLSTRVVASKVGLSPDTVDVQLDDVQYTALRISLSEPNNPIASLTIRTDQTALLVAEGLSTLGTWDPVLVAWDTAGISVDSVPVGGVGTWTVRPAASGTGTITISKGGESASITVTFLPGLPRRLVLYSAPPSSDSLPPTVPEPVIAGESVDILARVFDQNMELLSVYQTPPESDSISWSVTTTGGFDPGATLSATAGAQVTFTPTRAHHSYTITAAVTQGSNTYVDAVTFSVVAATPDTLIIEQSPAQAASPNTPVPYSPIVFQRTESLHDDVYAVLRDRFGNYHSTSTATAWATGAATVVTVESGVTSLGQGVVHREADSGQTVITAADTSVLYGGLGLSGTAVVQLLDVTYDSLRIVVDAGGTFVDIATVVMRTDQDTVLHVLGFRSSDSVWVQIPVNWSAIGVSLDPAPPGGAEEYAFSPNAAGTGIISVSLAGETDQVTVAFAPGLPTSVDLYAESGNPVADSLTPYADTVLVARAGVDFPLVAKVFDHNAVWLAEYETGAHDAEFNWELIDQGGVAVPTGSLTGAGYANTFLATEAFRTVQVVVTFSRPGGIPRTDTVDIRVVAGEPHHVVIEANPDAADASPTNDDPIDTVTISPTDTIAVVYAVIRDQYGNYVANSQSTDWASADTTLVTVSSVFASLGGGRVLRQGDSGSVAITATSLDNIGLTDATDDAIVRVVKYYYTELRIVGDDGTVLSALELSTNADTTLRIEGRRSDLEGSGDPAEWEPVSGNWVVTGGLTTDPPPSTGRQWTFSPTAPGTGSIVVYLDNDATTPDTLPATFTVGEPTRVTFTIITDPEDLRAGVPIEAVVQVYNDDGLVPGTWCFDGTQLVAYSDSLGDGDRPSPTLTVDGVDTLLNVNGEQGILVGQCFTNGADTVSFTLYYAPASEDSLHRLNVDVGDLQASTQPFALLPGDLATIEIVDGNGTIITETISLAAPDGIAVLITRGFDAYGNARGNELSDWSVSYAPANGLHQIARGDSVWRVFYETSTVSTREEGWIRAFSPVTPSIGDSVYVQISGPAVQLTQVVTADTNGNGYLDQLTFRYPSEVSLPTDSAALGAILADMEIVDLISNTEFTPVGIVGQNGTMTDSVFTVILEENPTEQPQTGMLPSVRYSGIPGVTDLTTYTNFTVDGAGPVIWVVTKYIDDDVPPRIEVALSERVQDSSGGSISLIADQIPVADLFNVYYRVPGTDDYQPINDMFANLTVLDVIGDSVIMFEMTNGEDLRAGYYLDLAVQLDSSGSTTDTLFAITDRAVDVPGGNPPRFDNRKTVVQEEGDISIDIIPFPNPTRASVAYVDAGDFAAGHNEEVHDLIMQPNPTLEGGVAGKFELAVPPVGTTVRLSRKIYDLMGNLVQEATIDDLLEAFLISSSQYSSRIDLPSSITIVLYWNGFNQDGLPVAPGVYREYTYVDYTSKDKRDQRVVTNYGIVR